MFNRRSESIFHDITSATNLVDYGVNYIIDGHNARISAFYSDLKISDAKDQEAFVLGIQYQF